MEIPIWPGCKMPTFWFFTVYVPPAVDYLRMIDAMSDFLNFYGGAKSL
jgi:hypothetical protein